MDQSLLLIKQTKILLRQISYLFWVLTAKLSVKDGCLCLTSLRTRSALSTLAECVRFKRAQLCTRLQNSDNVCYMSDTETELLQLLDLTWVTAPIDAVKRLIPQIKEQNKFLIRDHDQFRTVTRGMIVFYQPTEIIA